MKQRVQYHYRQKGKKSSMTDERIARLEAIGFAWVAPGFSQKSRKRKRADDEEEPVEDDVVATGPAPFVPAPFFPTGPGPFL